MGTHKEIKAIQTHILLELRTMEAIYEWWQLEPEDVQNSSRIITTNKPTPNFLQARCPSCRPTNSCWRQKHVGCCTCGQCNKTHHTEVTCQLPSDAALVLTTSDCNVANLFCSICSRCNASCTKTHGTNATKKNKPAISLYYGT